MAEKKGTGAESSGGFKSVVRENASTIASFLLDPQLRKTAEKIGASIPAGSLLRTEGFERVFAALKDILEKFGGRGGPIVKLITEKLVDFLDWIPGGFGDKEKHATKEAAGGNWKQEFFAAARERLKTATNKKDEFQKLKEELKLQFELLAAIDAIDRPPEEQESLLKDGEGAWQRFDEKMRKHAEAIWGAYETRRKKRYRPAKTTPPQSTRGYRPPEDTPEDHPRDWDDHYIDFVR